MSTVETEAPGLLHTQVAFARFEAEIAAVPDDELTVVNLDVMNVVTRILGAHTSMQALRPRMVAELPTFDLEAFDSLREAVFALLHTHVMYRTAQRPPRPLPELQKEALALRGVLFADLAALSGRELVEGVPLDRWKRRTGYMGIANDLLRLAFNFRRVWPAIQGKSATTMEDITRAEDLADEMMTAIGRRGRGHDDVKEWTLTRRRAFTWIMRRYERARRAVAYLLDRDEIEDVAKSLYAGRV